MAACSSSKAEISPGRFDLTGLTDAQADTFETTKVAYWINSRFSPPVRLICHRQEYDGKTFVVITVSEFDDIPIFCTRTLPHPDGPK